MSSVKPIILAFVLCDKAIREVNTNKLSLIGTFNGIYANSFPCVHHELAVYLAITEVHGRVPCELRMIALTDGHIIFNIPGEANFTSPTQVVEIVFQLAAVRFEHPGVYAFEFWAGNELLGSRKMSVQASTPQQRNPPQ